MAEEKNYQYVLPAGFVLKGGASDYVVEEVLGKGGFGITYKVKSRLLYQNIYVDVHFAVKEFFPDNCWRGNDNATLLAPPTKQDEIHDGLQDFINEGHRLQQVCKLNHNIVNVNEVFEANGTAYYVLEYLEGGSLTKRVRNSAEGRLTEQQMIDVMMPVGRAVQCLHSNHMLHLDIKPDNIVMRRDDSTGKEEPVLIDFGIAVHFGGDGTPTSKTPSLGVSPGFSPIEQYTQVKNFDPRFDVYAFSATCLYLLTGKAPVEALNMPAGYVRSVMPQNVSENVVAAIERGMSKEKSMRTSSIDELLDSFVASDIPIVTPEFEGPDEGPATRALGGIMPPPVAHRPVANPPAAPYVAPSAAQPVTPLPPIVPGVEQGGSYDGPGDDYDYKEPGSGKKKVVLAIVGGVLGLALLAGIALWAVKGCSSSRGASSSDEASIESAEDNMSEYYYDESDVSNNDADVKTLDGEKASIHDTDKNRADEKNAKDNTETKDSPVAETNPEPKKEEPPKTTTSSSSSSNNEVYKSAAHMPSFPGGQAALMSFINRNIRYPQAAQDNGIQGKVVVQFVVEKNGRVGEVKVARGVDSDLDREAVRVVKMLPAFSPGRNSDGDPVRVWYTLPVGFKLQGAN